MLTRCKYYYFSVVKCIITNFNQEITYPFITDPKVTLHFVEIYCVSMSL